MQRYILYCLVIFFHTACQEASPQKDRKVAKAIPIFFDLSDFFDKEIIRLANVETIFLPDMNLALPSLMYQH